MKYDYFDDKEEDDALFSTKSDQERAGIDGATKAAKQLLEDKLLPKSVVTKLGLILSILQSDEEEQLKINKAQDILNDITEDSNLPAFVKTQIWNLAGLLETV